MPRHISHNGMISRYLVITLIILTASISLVAHPPETDLEMAFPGFHQPRGENFGGPPKKIHGYGQSRSLQRVAPEMWKHFGRIAQEEQKKTNEDENDDEEEEAQTDSALSSSDATSEEDEVVIGYPPTTSAPSNSSDSTPAESANVPTEADTTDTEVNVGLEYFWTIYLKETIPEILKATQLYFNENDPFKKFITLVYQMSTYRDLDWRPYGDPCIIPADEFDSTPTRSKTLSNVTNTTAEPTLLPWNKIKDERNELAKKVVVFIQQAYSSNIAIGDYNQTIHDMVVQLRSRKTTKDIEDVYLNLKDVSGSVSIQCDPIKYLSCNPYFKDKSVKDLNSKSVKSVRIIEPIPGNCDCRFGFAAKGKTCYVKKFEDCNLMNLLDEYDYKILPVEVLTNMKNPPCFPGNKCINSLVCLSIAIKPLFSSLCITIAFLSAVLV